MSPEQSLRNEVAVADVAARKASASAEHYRDEATRWQKQAEQATAERDRARAVACAMEDQLAAAEADAEALATELAQWGWGDFHYGDTPHDPAVVAVLAAHQARLERDALVALRSMDAPSAVCDGFE